MSHFYVSAQGARGPVTRTGTKSSGIDAHVRGWDSGVKVLASVDSEGNDSFDVYRTSGSNGGLSDEYIGCVTLAGFVPSANTEVAMAAERALGVFAGRIRPEAS